MKQKNKHYASNFGKSMLLGGLGGLVLAIGFSALGYFMNKGSFTNLAEFICQQMIWIHLAIGVVIEGLVAYLYFGSKKLLSHFETNDDNETLELEFDDKIAVALLINTVFTALNFVLFGISIDERNPHDLYSILLFLAFAALAVTIEVKSIQLIQKKDPTKKADPSSIKFDKQWINSCDEAERLKIYKSSYHTYITMKYALVILIGFCLIAKMELQTGNLPILLVGGIWIFQSMTYGIYAQFHTKTKLTDSQY
jgi:hypothetical protein